MTVSAIGDSSHRYQASGICAELASVQQVMCRNPPDFLGARRAQARDEA
jgi:hypothetical protein